MTNPEFSGDGTELAAPDQVTELLALADDVYQDLTGQNGRRPKLHDWEYDTPPHTKGVDLKPRRRILRGAVNPDLENVASLKIHRDNTGGIDCTITETGSTLDHPEVRRRTSVTLNAELPTVVTTDEPLAFGPQPRSIEKADLLDSETAGALSLIFQGIRRQIRK